MKNTFKALVFAAPLIYASLSSAGCIGEAQLIAKVSQVKKMSATSCKVFISDARHFNVNQLCPLDFSEVFNKGIEIGVRSGVCEFNGAEISGIVVKNAAGGIDLD